MKYLTVLLLLPLIGCSQRKEPSLNDLRLKSVALELRRDSNWISKATGFFVKKDGQYFLITNLHVISGYDYVKQRFVGKDSIPTYIMIHLPGQTWGDKNSFTEALYDNAGIEKYKKMTLTRNFVADIAVLPVAIPAGVTVYPIDQYNEPDLKYGDELVSFGFPMGNAFTNKYPLYKSATIASDPKSQARMPLGDMSVPGPTVPGILINYTSAQGVSGSPVFYKVPATADKEAYYTLVGILSTYYAEPHMAMIWKTSFLDYLK